MSCPDCGGPWEVAFFSGGPDSALEGRECQDCGREWTEVLRA